MGMRTRTNWRWWWVGGLSLALALGALVGRVWGAAVVADPGPDLVIQSLRTIPETPMPGVPFNIEVRIRNAGTSAAGGFTTHLFVNPPGPPQLDTPDTSFTFLFGLNAGASFTWTYRNVILDTPGCGHMIYAWVDRANEVAEDDETNNQAALGVCVGMTPTPPGATSTPSATPTATRTATATPTLTPTARPCQPDLAEPDPSCAAATLVMPDGVHQFRNLCPNGDVDWFKFNALAGQTYTIVTTNVGPDGDTVLSLYNVCDQPPLASNDPAFGRGAEIVWEAPNDGIYYVKVQHHDATYGPDTSYEFFVTASASCPGDDFEPDNSCSAARDIIVGATPQIHLFCSPGDTDWVRFTAVPGATYAISANGIGPDADPVIFLHNECAFSAPIALGQPSPRGQTLDWTAASGGVYYVGVKNHDPSKAGSTTQYSLAVSQSFCGADTQEDDNSATVAKPILVNGVEQSRDFCPVGDQDWARFDATAGQLYIIETFELAANSDTVLCLFGGDGTTQLVCNDDGGGGLASRIRWTAPTTGVYYARVKHAEADPSGPTTAYKMAVSQGEPLDAFEPNGSAATARSILTNGAPQTHNITPAGDQDWVRFDVEAGVPYVIQTLNLAGDADTSLFLYDKDGSTLLVRNDDYGAGVRSLITYVFPTSGTYYARVQHYRSNRSGRGTRYDLSVTRGGQPPAVSPTPTLLPTPTATTTPPASGVRTLVVTNRERLVEQYGETKTQQVLDSLVKFASDTQVRGLVIQTDHHTAALTAYIAWNASNPTTDNQHTAKANAVSSAVRNLIFSYLDTNPGVEYIVLVGNDKVLPFRRVPDRTRFGEANYQASIVSGTSQWAAYRDNMTLTDDFYADRDPLTINGQAVYVPDYAISRLPEGADQIVRFIDDFLSQRQILLERVLVTGYDFVVDTGKTISDTLKADLGPLGVIDSSLIGDNWTAAQLRERQFIPNPGYTVQFINGHASHQDEGAPQGSGLQYTDIRSAGPPNQLRPSLIVTLGCHSGFNDLGTLAGGDLVDSFFQRGANYIANTGYGWGSNAGLGWSERLMNNYVRALTQGSRVSIGKAVMTAKQQFVSQSISFDAYDEKSLMESTLYGLPQYELVSGGVLSSDNPFPSVALTTTFGLAGGLTVADAELVLPRALGALPAQQTVDGSYFSLDGSAQFTVGEPAQPQFHTPLAGRSGGRERAHGAVLVGGRYTDVALADPVVAHPVNEYIPRDQWAEPSLADDAWLPARPLGVQRQSLADRGEAERRADTLVTQFGQYNAQTGRERLYDQMQLSVFYSSSPDFAGPEISYVGEQVDWVARQATVKVEAQDRLSGVFKGLVTYTYGDGRWQSVDLVYDAPSMKWFGQFAARPGALYFVQMVDKAGNVTTATNKGRYYALPAPPGSPLFLPYIRKAQ